MEAVEDNRKLISAATPLEVYAAIRRRERAGGISRLKTRPPRSNILRLEAGAHGAGAAESRPCLKPRANCSTAPRCAGPTALQLGAALVARDMFHGTVIIFVSASPTLLEAARADGFEVLDPGKLPAAETNAA